MGKMSITKTLLVYIESGIITSAKQLVDELLNSTIEDIQQAALSIPQPIVSAHNIPQYSSFANGTSEMLKYLRRSGDHGPSFIEIGEHFLESGHNATAYIKYGENHAKLAELLGLVSIKRLDKKRAFLSDIGREIEKLKIEKQDDCFAKLALKIPIVQETIRLNIESPKELEAHLVNYISPVTAIRRRKNTWLLIEKVRGGEKNGV